MTVPLGRRRFQLERDWAGHGQSVFRNISFGRDDVHRIKVDENEGFCITTHMRGKSAEASNTFQARQLTVHP